MLRECQEHRYFRGETCPRCESKGKFLMSDEEVNRLGRIMAGVLRHFPERFELDMDDNGFIDLIEFVDSIRRRRNQFHWLRQHHIHAVVDTDEKGRYQIEGGMVRATYGHSIDLDLDLPMDDIPDELYYPATIEEMELLLETGLKPSDRKEVHLSKTAENALEAGRHRASRPYLMAIDASSAIADGFLIKQAGTTVYTTKEIPDKYLRPLEDFNAQLKEKYAKEPVEEENAEDKGETASPSKSAPPPSEDEASPEPTSEGDGAPQESPGDGDQAAPPADTGGEPPQE